MDPRQIQGFQEQIMAWYRSHARPLPWRKTREPYRIWVSEVMAQQTRIPTVIPYYLSFMDRFPRVHALAEADLQAVLKAWEGLGYYSRARNLHRAANAVVRDHGGKIPGTWDDFRALPGVGDYIAAAVLSIAFGRPHAVVDGNVKRVLSRMNRIDAPVNNSASHRIFQPAAEEILPLSDPGTFNQALMELGALVCTPRNPDCRNCPGQSRCLARAEGTTGLYPKREKRQPVPEYHLALGVVKKNGRILITQRKPDGLLGGLWEFPGGRLRPQESPEAACVRKVRQKVNLDVQIEEKIARIRHGYTHFKILADVFWCRHVSGRVKRTGPVAHQWIRIAEIERYPFPGAHHKFIPLLG